MTFIALAAMLIAASAIGTVIGNIIKDMIDVRIMNRRFRDNSRYLKKRREERDELAKRRRHRDS